MYLQFSVMALKITISNIYKAVNNLRTNTILNTNSPVKKGYKLTAVAQLNYKSPVANAVEELRNKTNNLIKNPEKDVDLRFSDHQASYESKTTFEVFRALCVFQMCSFNVLVNNNDKLMKLGQSILGETLFGWLMKATFYGHFVAGEDEKKIEPILKRLQSFGVKTMLDYAIEDDISHEEPQKLELTGKSTEKSEADKIYEELPQYKAANIPPDRRYKVTSARTYFYLNEATCEKNVEHFQKSLYTVATNTKCSGIVAVKLTALGRPQILSQLSEVIMRARNFVSEITGSQGNIIGQNISAETIEKNLKNIGITDTKKFLQNVVTDEEGVIHLFPWSGIINENFKLNEGFQIPSRKEGRMVKLISKLSEEEEEMFRNMLRRLNTLIQTAKELDVRIIVDAEQTYFQPAISRITMEMMNKYNADQAIVLNTYQCYLKNTFNELYSDVIQANRQNFCFGAKLVRGAYIDQERERAAELKYPDPINPTYEATTEMYHQTLAECLKHIKSYKNMGQPNRMNIMVATHNEDTVRFAIKQIKKLGISPADGMVSFGQLYGMSDFITFHLGQLGYSSYKYVPYGPVNKVLPYLSRRALENKSVLDKLKKEKYLLRKELVSRLMEGKIFYKPTGKYDVVC